MNSNHRCFLSCWFRRCLALAFVMLFFFSLVQGAFAQSSLRDNLKDLPITNTTIFLLFVIVVIVVVLVLKYSNKPSDVEKISKKIQEEDEERDFLES